MTTAVVNYRCRPVTGFELLPTSARALYLLYIAVLASFASLGVANPACADDTPSPQEFAVSSVTSNLFEIEAAKLALQRATGNDTKAFARDMIRDHTPAGVSLASAARSQGIALPAELDTEYQSKLDALKVAPADQFDQAYLSTQVTAHEEAYRLFQAYAKGGPDGPLRNSANAILPILKMHNIRIQGLASASGGKADQ